MSFARARPLPCGVSRETQSPAVIPRAAAVDGSEQSGGDGADDAARDLYGELTDDLLYDPAIGRATMLGLPCVRVADGSWRPTTTRRAIWS